MKKFIWKVRFAWHICKQIGFKPGDIIFSWYNATVWADEYEDFADMHPGDAVWEEISCWDAE